MESRERENTRILFEIELISVLLVIKLGQTGDLNVRATSDQIKSQNLLEINQYIKRLRLHLNLTQI